MPTQRSYARLVRNGPARATLVDTSRHCVYTIFNHDDEPIYIGCTIDPDRRLRQHRRGSWGAEAARMTYMTRRTKREALDLEARLISAATPRYNTIVPDPATAGSAALSTQTCECPNDCCDLCDDLAAKGRAVSERCKKRMQRQRKKQH